MMTAADRARRTCHSCDVVLLLRNVVARAGEQWYRWVLA
jgi:hypothetical protein